MLFYKTKSRMRCGWKLNDLLSKSFFLVSAGGNDFSAFSERGMAKEDAPSYITRMVSTYVISTYVKATIYITLLHITSMHANKKL
jgi:hypothetical protein